MSKSSEDTVPIEFTPPMWEQRKNKVKDILKQNKIKEVCDLGCGSGVLLSELLYFNGMKTLIGVDLDSESLSRATDNCVPGIPSYINKRKYPLEVIILKGSILDRCDDIPYQIQSITLCEVIEHITLAEVPLLAENIFNWINPKLVIVTTPNKDFNNYFPDPSKLRHYDHKFEWTQQEFLSWCSQVCTDYKYSLHITGVGLPRGYDEKGFCSQIAVFHRLKRKPSREPSGVGLEVLNRTVVPKNFSTDFDHIFYNNFLYSFNLARNWMRIDYDDGVPINQLYKVPSINILCDGSMSRLYEMMHSILPKYPLNLKIEDNCVYISSYEIYNEDIE